MPKMLFKPGQSGNPSGLTKGGGNAKRARLKVQEILDMNDFSPFDKLINFAKFGKSEKVRYDATKELCSYIAAKPKSIEMTMDNENPFIINLNFDPKLSKNENVDS